MALAAWRWWNVSPEDGCTLVEYMAAAEGASALARVASGNPEVQRRTTRRLLADGGAHQVDDRDAQLALSEPGRLLWRESGTDDWALI
jgi:hypothetical protein